MAPAAALLCQREKTLPQSLLLPQSLDLLALKPHLAPHSLVRSRPTIPGSGQAWFKPQQAVCSVCFAGRTGAQPQHPVCVRAPSDTPSHAPLPTGVLELLPTASPARAPVPLQVPTQHRAAAELTAGMDPTHGQALPSPSPHLAQLPDALLGSLQAKVAAAPLEKKVTPFLHASISPILYLVLPVLCINPLSGNVRL